MRLFEDEGQSMELLAAKWNNTDGDAVLEGNGSDGVGFEQLARPKGDERSAARPNDDKLTSWTMISRSAIPSFPARDNSSRLPLPLDWPAAVAP